MRTSRPKEPMLRHDLNQILLGHTAIIGVGDVNHGDDAVGPMIARTLLDAGMLNIIESGQSPELDTWRIRELAPDAVLFVDAVDFGGSPGDAALLQADDLRSNGFDTHRAPLRLTMDYLERELGCKCLVLAIQPRDVRQGALMCDDVRSSCENVARMILDHTLACKH